MKKVALAVQMIEKRVAYADHVVAGIPSERQLAEELGLSRNTVRTAVQQLIEKGVLVRQENGRLDVAAPASGPVKRNIGFVAPVGFSQEIDQWRQSVDGVLLEHNIKVRFISYAHWADPAIQDALSGFDGMFLVPLEEKMPPWLLLKMQDPSCRVVVLDQNYSLSGLPSVVLFPPAMENKLFDHLYRLGHRRFDCLNTQVQDSVICERIAMWKGYLESRGMPGRLLHLERRNPIESGYQLVRDALREGHSIASALFCTTGPAAVGAMRALHEAGLKIGVEVSVCAVNSEGLGRYLVPSLTALESPPRSLFLHRACEWLLGDDKWEGPLLSQPEEVPLFEGESTGPAPLSQFISPARI